MEVAVFHTLDGSPVEGARNIPFTGCSWSEDAAAKGQLNLDIRWHRLMRSWGARSKLTPWKYSIAVLDGDRVRFAGPIEARRWEGMTLSVTASDGWGILENRLVLNHLLDARWVDGEILLDEENPRPEWVLQITGQSLYGIGAALIRETLKWGDLLIDSPPSEAGTNVRTYRGWDFATVADRIRELTEVRNGPVLRFEPYLREDGHLRLRYVESGDRRLHSWVQAAPGQRIRVDSVDEDAASLATEAYALGGRDEDVVLAARSRSTTLTGAGFPVIQRADTSHSTVSRLDTLLGHTGRIVDDGSLLPESLALTVPADIDVVPGDAVDLEIDDPYIGRTLLTLSVARVSGDTSEWQQVDLVPREA